MLVLLGMGLLFAGGELVVTGAVGLAERAGISDRVIGLTVVAMATSLPELVSSLIAALRGRKDVALGNVIGSSIFNLLAIFGVAALLKPLTVDPRFLSFPAGDVWWMLGFTLLFGVFAFSRKRVARIEGRGGAARLRRLHDLRSSVGGGGSGAWGSRRVGAGAASRRTAG